MAIELAPADRSGARGDATRRAGTPSRAATAGASRRTRPRDLMYFTSQLALMLEVGTSVGDAIGALARQITNPAMKAILGDVLRDLEQGRQLSDAMASHPRTFDEIYVSMIRAAEAGGFLKNTLERMAEMQERRLALAAQLKSALTYPCILCVMSAAVVVFVLIGVLPKFSAFFAGKEALLPGTTLFLMAFSRSITHFWPVYIAVIVGLIFGFRFFVRSAWGRSVLDTLAIRAPVVSAVCNQMFTCDLLRVLGHLLESRVPLMEALAVTRTTMRNGHYARFIDRISTQVQQGGKFSRAFADFPYIIESVRQMLITAEDSGQMYHVMLRLARFYDVEVEQELKTKAALIEPVALVVIGGVIGVIVSGIILPLFKLAYALK